MEVRVLIALFNVLFVARPRRAGVAHSRAHAHRGQDPPVQNKPGDNKCGNEDQFFHFHRFLELQATL